jgi:DNA-binding NarL/FixJ family response regulator
MKSVQEAARLGAIGYVLKHGSKDDILAGIRTALENLEDEEAEE